MWVVRASTNCCVGRVRTSPTNPATLCGVSEFTVVCLRSMKLRRPYRKWQKLTPNQIFSVVIVAVVDNFAIVVIVGGRGLAAAKFNGTEPRNNTTTTAKLSNFVACFTRAFKVVFKVDKSDVTTFL